MGITQTAIVTGASIYTANKLPKIRSQVNAIAPQIFSASEDGRL